MTVNYHSKTGITLPFEPYDYFGPWIPGIGGLYVFAIYIPSQNLWRPLYIGKAKCFKDRFVNHHKWDAAFKKGVHLVLTVKVDDARLRTKLEAEMIREFDPELNEILPLGGLSNCVDLTSPSLGLGVRRDQITLGDLSNCVGLTSPSLGLGVRRDQITLGGLSNCEYRG